MGWLAGRQAAAGGIDGVATPDEYIFRTASVSAVRSRPLQVGLVRQADK